MCRASPPRQRSLSGEQWQRGLAQERWNECSIRKDDAMDEDELRSALAKSYSAMAELRRLDADLTRLVDATTRALCDTRRELEGFLAQRYLDRRFRSASSSSLRKRRRTY
jgi:hypothetical protein